MGKSIGIVICNYNKQDYVLNCIKSLFESSINDFDIYVVDNASTDNSVDEINKAYKDKVNLIVNSENLGGSGGFNTGLREVLKKDYQYLMCVDNDVVFDKDAVAELKNFLDIHEEVGMVGSCVYYMDTPDRIWSYSGSINMERYVQVDNYRNCVDSSEIPEVVYGDYVPACSLMARIDATRKVGIMPEENFIYLDDMEWGYRFNQAGYKVAVYGKSKAWHKGGGRNAGNTFIHYYMWRNRLRFFLKILPDDKREDFADTILTEMFRMVYSVNLKGEINIVKTLMYAFDDAIHDVTGKAADYKILPRPAVPNRLEQALKGGTSVLIKFNDDYEALGNIIKNIRKFAPDMQLGISVKGCKASAIEVQKQCEDATIETIYCPDHYDKHLIICDHIFKITSDMPQDIYIDAWCNIIFSANDFIYASSFEQTKELFLSCKKGLLVRS